MSVQTHCLVFLGTHLVRQHSMPENLIQIVMNVQLQNLSVFDPSKNLAIRAPHRHCCQIFQGLYWQSVVSVRQILSDDVSCATKPPSVSEDTVSNLPIKELYENGSVLATARLSSPVSNLSVSLLGWDANEVVEDGTFFTQSSTVLLLPLSLPSGTL